MFENLELLEGCRNLVEHTRVKPGESVLIVIEHGKDAVIAETIGFVAKERGAAVNTLWIEPTALGASYEPSPVFAGALAACDVGYGVINFPILYTETCARAMLDYGVSWCELDWMGSIEGLSSPAARMPLEVMYKIFDWTRDTLLNAKEWRLTCKRGSDFVCNIPSPTYVVGSSSGGQRRGCFEQFHSGERCFWPGLTANGVLYFDGFYGIGYCRSGTPIKTTIENGWCTKIEGGPEARWLDSITRRFKNGRHCCEVAIGENPKARINLRDPSLIEAQRNSGVVHIALGDSSIFGGDIVAGLHLDGTILEPTVVIDGQTVIENGVPTYLHDPGIRAAAAKYGEPDQILAHERIVIQ